MTFDQLAFGQMTFCHFVSDLFLDPMIHRLTEMCLVDILSAFNFVKFDDPIPGIDSFYDFYTQVIELKRS
jgi:hypothetical protein